MSDSRSTGQDKVRERLAAMVADLDPVDYLPFDQDDRLPEPPWKPTDQPLIDWEAAHGHDVRMKCYPEFGCQVIGQDTARDLASAVAALTAVLDVHHPEVISVGGYSLPLGTKRTICKTCTFKDWPCSTVLAVAAALGVTE